MIFGTTVRLIASDTGDAITYKIVGEDEADLKAGKISVMSPIARALIGQSVDDEVTVKTPNGETSYAVDGVDHV